MTVLSDFVVVNTLPEGAPGKWKSQPFETGGRLPGGEDQYNAYLTLVLTTPSGGADVEVRPIVNGHTFQSLIAVKANSRRTEVAAFPASFLSAATGNHNVIELHSVGEKYFNVMHVICHFRQNS
ncbi:MAG: hypothetical protein QOE23_812 [Pseudonocardiales bacterium]|jgi:hypothetical protein|nr:hypothetical protein [Pseudonocardiales bacterium]